jgi:hypothetical protein
MVPFYSAIRLPVFSLHIKSTISVPLNTHNLPSPNKNCCYHNCMNMNHHLTNNSGPHLSHRFHLVIRHLVKQYITLLHLLPSVQTNSSSTSHCSICSPQYRQTQAVHHTAPSAPLSTHKLKQYITLLHLLPSVQTQTQTIQQLKQHIRLLT